MHVGGVISPLRAIAESKLLARSFEFAVAVIAQSREDKNARDDFGIQWRSAYSVNDGAFNFILIDENKRRFF